MKCKEILHCIANGIKPGSKYPPSVREFCLKLSYASSRAYDVVRSTFNNHLPDKSTMRAWYSNSSFNSPPGVNYACMGLLQKKVAEQKVRNNEFICNFCVDEMAIRQQIQWIDGDKRMIGY